MLDPGRANTLLAINRVRAAIRMDLRLAAWIYPPAFAVVEANGGALGASIARFDPSEIIISVQIADDPGAMGIVSDFGVAVMPRGARQRRCGAGPQARRIFGVATLDGFGQLTGGTRRAALAIVYIERTQIGVRPPLAFRSALAAAARWEIDAATRANLELTRTLSGQREGSLASTIDLTVTTRRQPPPDRTAVGAVTDVAAIAARLDAVGFFVESPFSCGKTCGRRLSRRLILRGHCRSRLCNVGGRAILRHFAKVCAHRRKLALLARTGGIAGRTRKRGELLAHVDAGLCQKLEEALADDLP